MSASAHSFHNTAGYAIEKSQKGLPSPRELFEPGYTWQHGIDDRSGIDTKGPHFDGNAHWSDRTKRAELLFFADAANAEWASKVLTIGSWILNNTDPEDEYQKKVNRLLAQMAVLSRAAAELSTKRPGDDRLSTLNKSFVDSYRCYYETLHQSQNPCTNLELNADALMDKITTLATILAETPTAFPDSSLIPPISPLSATTSGPGAPGGASLGDSSKSHLPSSTTSKGPEFDPSKDSGETSSPSSQTCNSEGSGRLKKLFGGRKGKDKEV